MGKLPEDLRRRVAWIDDEIGILEPYPGVAPVLVDPSRPPGPRRGPRPLPNEDTIRSPPWPYANSLIVDDGDVLLVDAGLPTELAQAFAPHVDVCLLTHTHLDHSLTAHEFPNVWAPWSEAAAVSSAEGFAHVHGVQRADRALVQSWLQTQGFRAANPARLYRPGGVLRLASTTWHILTLPGHSPACTYLYEPRRRVLFAPDLEGASHNMDAPWYGLPACELEGLETAVERLGELEIAYLAQSHAPVRRRGIRTLFKGIAGTLRERDQRLLDALEAPASLIEITERGLFYGKAIETDPITRYFARTMADKHVAALLARNLVTARQDGRFERV